MEKTKSKFKNDSEVKQIKSIPKLISLFLIPGLLIALGYTFIAKGNLPGGVELGIAAMLIMLPVELGIIAYFGKKELGVWSIKEMIVSENNLKLKQYMWIVPTMLAWMLMAFGLGRGVDVFLKDALFSWLPDWYILTGDYSGFSKAQLMVALGFAVFVTGIILPIVEEIYFRGFLLSRMEWMGIFAPVVNAFLFSLYHFWSPWQTLTRTFVVIPLSYTYYKTKNLRVTIIVHCLINIIGDGVVLFMLLLK